jgi:predicted MPP superfamily phosphohydrolase
MKKFLLFFSIVLSVYGLINFYIFIHLRPGIPEDYKIIFAIVFWLLAFSFVGGRILERQWLSVISEALTWIGSFYLAAVVFLFLFVLVFDLLQMIDLFYSFVNPEFKNFYFLLASCATVLIVAAGYANARFFRVRMLQLTVPKQANGMKRLNIVVASDIHLGTIIGRSRLDRIVRKINSLEPDIVLLPGDVVDEDLAPVIKENLGESLRKIRSKFGVISVTGNHEYIGGVEAAYRYLTEHGITVLRDDVLKVNNSFYIVGREDRSYRVNGQRRKPLEGLMAAVNKELPVIMMDHQPSQLEEAEQNGIDLQLSGHTHHGQIWPFSYFTKRIFEVSWGYKKKGNTHVYVSCGVGTWGPPVRLGNRPEIVNIHLNFLSDGN